MNSNGVSSKKETAILVVGMLGLMGGLVHPLMWALSLVLMALYWQAFESQSDVDKSPSIWVWLVPLTVMLVTLFYVAQPFAPDDLLRSVVSHHINYDYRKMFGHAPLLPEFNLWIGYEYLAGMLEKQVGVDYTVRIIVMAVFALYIISLSLAVAKLTAGNKDRWLIVCVLMMIAFVGPTGGRILIGRPEIMFTALLFGAVWMRPVVWVVLSLAMIPFYWLAPIYAAGALLMNISVQKRLLYGALIASSGVCFWFHYSSGMWFETLMLVPQWEQNRILEVAELRPISGALMSVAVIGMVGFILASVVLQNKKRYPYLVALLVVTCIYLVPNMVRYIATVGGLIILMVAACMPDKQLPLSGHAKFLIVALMMLMSLKYSLEKAGDISPEPVFTVPSDAYVLSEFNRGLYNTILRNPTAKFAPSYEFGANTKGVQELVKGVVQEHSIDCKSLVEHGFTHVQEKQLREIPECLKLNQIYGEWRLWKVRP